MKTFYQMLYVPDDKLPVACMQCVCVSYTQAIAVRLTVSSNYYSLRSQMTSVINKRFQRLKPIGSGLESKNCLKNYFFLSLYELRDERRVSPVKRGSLLKAAKVWPKRKLDEISLVSRREFPVGSRSSEPFRTLGQVGKVV